MKLNPQIAIIICFLVGQSVKNISAQNLPSIRFHGLKIFVSSLKEAENFYHGRLGFEMLSRNGNQIVLSTNACPIYLEKSENGVSSNNLDKARTGISIQTYKLLPRIDEFRKLGISTYDTLLLRNGVGISIPFNDPSGNTLSLIEVQVRNVPKFNNLRVYNTGVTVANMETAQDFYVSKLGFQVWSLNYLPAALPLKHTDGSFAFMIHYRSELKRNTVTFGSSPHMSLVMETDHLNRIETLLVKEKIPFEINDKSILVTDPSGNVIEIIEFK